VRTVDQTIVSRNGRGWLAAIGLGHRGFLTLHYRVIA
jgi:hypothetical protein